MSDYLSRLAARSRPAGLAQNAGGERDFVRPRLVSLFEPVAPVAGPMPTVRSDGVAFATGEELAEELSWDEAPTPAPAPRPTAAGATLPARRAHVEGVAAGNDVAPQVPYRGADERAPGPTQPTGPPSARRLRWPRTVRPHPGRRMSWLACSPKRTPCWTHCPGSIGQPCLVRSSRRPSLREPQAPLGIAAVEDRVEQGPGSGMVVPARPPNESGAVETRRERAAFAPRAQPQPIPPPVTPRRDPHVAVVPHTQQPAAPSVQVTIGRIEVRAAQTPAAPLPASRPAAQAPALPLDVYLRQRSQGGRG